MKAEDILCSKLTLVIDFHIISYGCGRGRGVVPARRLSRWHMLSYDNMMDDHSDCGKVCSISNSQDRTIRKTWDGDSDLWVKNPAMNMMSIWNMVSTCVSRTFPYRGQKQSARYISTVKELPPTSKLYEKSN